MVALAFLIGMIVIIAAATQWDKNPGFTGSQE